ncbi:hypothetical protein Sphch_3226 [Sphingobium chlorophenolicum L-1]|uniref:Uncharacterized protein n=1 Tax=Sphingobium chlorophenolicum L-1 TaxID=690566 RepID=F6F325_SPHCR|nr:hypothetical protein [Sphingobium chlorophenolicum]AEG50837.1 hypothetical protein Sphch_3226 [Sphingobium chlorophenolicum L-1]
MTTVPASLHFVMGETGDDPSRIEWLVAELARRQPALFERWREAERTAGTYDPEEGDNELLEIAEDVFVFLHEICTFDLPTTPSALWLDMKRIVRREMQV